MHALATDVPQPRLQLEMCHSCGMVVDDSVLQDLHRAGALARELRPHQAQQEGEGARGDKGEKTSGCAGLGTFQLVAGLFLATA